MTLIPSLGSIGVFKIILMTVMKLNTTHASPDPNLRRQNLWHRLYEKLVKINDTPQNIALGFGLGVFAGILPGTGPVAAVLLAVILKANRIAAFTGGLLTNTWLSLVTFVMSVKIGAWITGAEWSEIYQQCKTLFKNFHWKNFFDTSILEIIYPLIVGYLVISSVLGVITYGVVLTVLKKREKGRMQ